MWHAPGRMKILSRALFLLFILIGVLVAVSNAQPVQLALWPLPHIIVMPVYLLVIAMLMLGVLAGLSMGWWAGRHHRRRAREAGGEAAPVGEPPHDIADAGAEDAAGADAAERRADVEQQQGVGD